METDSEAPAPVGPPLQVNDGQHGLDAEQGTSTTSTSVTKIQVEVAEKTMEMDSEAPAPGPPLQGIDGQDGLDAEQGTSTIATSVTDAAEMAPKATMMSAVGPNFVIPKNKALVPVTRTTKWEPLDPKKGELRLVPRKTNWGPDLTEEPAVKRGRALAYQTRAEQLAAQLEANNLEIDNNEATRSPSPPPIYDSMGHRMNTREGRKRDRLDAERREALGECMNLNPFYKPPAGYRPVLKEAKCFIPAKENPGYNFIGLILGPRGNTQKRLESETGCKITIRGKGSIKDGKSLPYRHGKDNDGISEELHIHIAAETWEKVDAAVAIIEPLLIPVDEDRNIYKMKQLRELAEMNGTVRDFFRICTLCGEEGHKEWQCPKDKLQLFQAKVICRFCGDASHPTMDCPLKLSGQGKAIDKEYLSFLEELGIGLGGIDPQAKADLEGTSGLPAETPQPMSASAAQPMFAKWMEGFNDFNRRMAAGGSESGGFPRLPFPFPFPPPGPHAMRFLAPFLNPAFLEAFKGRPVPPPMQMMAFMFSAFRGRFPFPPFGGLRPDIMRPPTDMMRPPMPPSSAPEVPPSNAMDNLSLGQAQSADSVGGVVQNDSESEQQHTNVVSSVTSFAEVPKLLSPASSSMHSLEPMPRSSPVPAFLSTVSELSKAELPPGLSVPPVAPPPIFPLVRPLPSIRPVIQNVVHQPLFTPVGCPGFVRNIVSPLGVETSNMSPLDTKSIPTWSQMHSSSASDPEKPALEANSSFLSTPSSVGPLRKPQVDSPCSFTSGERHPHPTGSDNSLFTSRHSPSMSMHLGSYPQRSVPYGASAVQPSFIADSLQPFPTQYGMAGDSQLKYPFSHPELSSGPQYGSVSGNFPAEDYKYFTPSSQRLTPGLPLSTTSMAHSANAYQQDSNFSHSEVPYARSHDHLHEASTDFGRHAKYGNNDAYRLGVRGPSGSYDREEKGTSLEAFERNYNYEPSIPPHILQQNLKSPWSSDLVEPSLQYSSRGDHKRWI